MERGKRPSNAESIETTGTVDTVEEVARPSKHRLLDSSDNSQVMDWCFYNHHYGTNPAMLLMPQSTLQLQLGINLGLLVYFVVLPVLMGNRRKLARVCDRCRGYGIARCGVC